MTWRHLILALTVFAWGGGAHNGPATQPTPTRPAAEGESAQPARANDLQYWLRHAKPVETQPASAPGDDDAATSSPAGACPPEYAVPGVVELSEGRILAGWLYTAGQEPVKVFLPSQQRWRLVPLASVLSVTAVVVEEKMEPEWRWKATGAPERVYTGRQYPTRRYIWRFLLADGSEITGTVKGEPVWLVSGGARWGPFVLHERQRGQPGQSLGDLTHVRRIIVSRRLMEAVLAPAAAPEPKTIPQQR